MRITGYQQVINSMKRTVDLTQNLAPVFRKIVGEYGDRREWTIIGSIQRNFITQSEPEGASWPELSKQYAKRKNVKFPGKSMLIASGTLFNSLVYGDKGNVYQLEPRRLTYGSVIPYGVFHMEGPKQRKFIGFTELQMEAFDKLITEQIKQTWEAS